MTEMKKPCVMYCHHEHIQVSINITHVNIRVCAIISACTYGLHICLYLYHIIIQYVYE